MHLLRRRSFALLFAGTAINQIGSWCSLMAIWGFAAWHFHADAGQVALVILSWAVPGALLGAVAGVPIDRFGPKRVLLAADTLGAVAAFGMLLASRYSDLAVAGLFLGTAKAFSTPAAAALPPRMVDDADLVAANGLLGSAADSSIVFGPLLATGAIALWGFHAAFVIDGLTWLAGVAVVSTLRLRPVDPERHERLVSRLAGGFRLTARSPMLRLTMLLSTAVYLTWGAFAVIEPLYVRDVLGRSPTTLAVFQVVFGVGLVGAGLLIVRLGERVASARALAATVVLSGVAAGTYIGTRSTLVAAVGVFLWGMDVAFFAAPARTLLQRHSPVAAHGRVLALHTTLHSWGDLLALPVAAFLAEAWGVRSAGIAFAALACAVGALSLGAARRLEPRAVPALVAA